MLLAAAGLTLPGTAASSGGGGGGRKDLRGLSDAPERFRISHAQLTHLFERYDADRARYIPAEQLRYQYPEAAGVYHDPDSEEARTDAVAAAGRAAVLDSVQLQLSTPQFGGTGSSADLSESVGGYGKPQLLDDL